MGSQLRFDPSFFGLALRASAEADALLFSAHEGLSGITRPARAGLRLTSPAKASGEWGKREDLRHQDGFKYAKITLSLYKIIRFSFGQDFVSKSSKHRIKTVQNTEDGKTRRRISRRISIR